MIMAIFNSYEAVSLDLDLYAFVNKIPVHIATMGLGIPKVLNDRDTVYDGMSVVSQLEARHGFTINNAIVDKIKENEYEYLNLLDDKEVRDYVMNSKISEEFYAKLTDMIQFLVPQYIEEGKQHLVIGIGCTGGRHRSVTISNLIYDDLVNRGYRVVKKHRDSMLR